MTASPTPDRLLSTVASRLAAIEDARALYAERLAPGFNPLQFLRTDELGLSRILAWLLDPRAGHAQGTAFLEAFLGVFAPDWPSPPLKGASVRLEAPCAAGGRVDILVTGPGWAIAIENKPTAGDQPDQLVRYRSAIADRPLHRMVYLAGHSDRLPAETSLPAEVRATWTAAGELVCASYADLGPWLDRCRGLCRSDRVRGFIDDLQDHFVIRFEGAPEMTETRAVVTAILSDHASLSAAAVIASAWPAAQSELIGRLEADLTEAAQGAGWRIGELNLGRSKHAAFDLLAPNLDDVAFTLQFDESNYRSFCWGISLVHPDLDRNRALRSRIEASRFGQGDPAGPTEAWAWWRYSSESDPDLPIASNWSGSQPWALIRDGGFVPLVMPLAAEMTDLLRSA